MKGLLSLVGYAALFCGYGYGWYVALVWLPLHHVFAACGKR